MRNALAPFLAVLSLVSAAGAESPGFVPSDHYRLRSVGDVALAPDGAWLAYAVSNRDVPGKPYSQLHVRNLASGKTVRLGGEKEPSSGAVWSADGKWLAWSGRLDGKSGLIVSKPDGSQAKWLAGLEWTNHPLPDAGEKMSWSPDAKRIAFVSSTPGPESEAAGGDPAVITRYLYKPQFDEGLTRFNDNRRTHIFIADIASGAVRQLTSGQYYEHSIDWSPAGDEILFVSNREPEPDLFFNYDIFAVNPATGEIRRLTATESAEYRPRWSPDGRRILFQATRRGLTDLETTMEDTHVWVMDRDGANRREIGAAIDNRQGEPLWSPDGSAAWFTVQERGNVRLYRLPVAGGAPEVVAGDRGAVGSFSLAKGGLLAYAYSGPADLSQLYLKSGAEPARKLTELNAEALAGKAIAPVESLTFISNDNRWEVEAFLTRPLGMTAASRHPLMVVIHGGPHGQQGPAFNLKNQIYAARGWATLMVNYRGSTGDGQKFADGVFGDQNGNEAQDVLYALSAAMRRNPWIDRGRLGIEGGSYGGQLTAWIVTQTHIFKSAIPSAPIINLVSYNYMTYYNMYEQMTWGVLPHQGNLMDRLWERSALKYVAQVKTPVMLMHGENDSDVPIAESEQFYIALKDAGVESVMVRYPREGHGLRENKHVVDQIDRSIAWHEKHFPATLDSRQP
ncbi:MAG: S9 family peptidase [Bryobacterales bacterium]|nr:S9 family peptidase [Bryobacterales bacterium]